MNSSSVMLGSNAIGVPVLLHRSRSVGCAGVVGERAAEYSATPVRLADERGEARPSSGMQRGVAR